MCDTLRRTIETQLYTQTLIPESRGDVLGLIENLDRILGFFEGTLWGLSIEKPDIPAEFHEGYRNLTNTGGEAVEAMVLASRAFFGIYIPLAIKATRLCSSRKKPTKSAPS